MKQSVGKEPSTGKPRRFIPKVAPSGPPWTKEVTPPERPQPSKPVVSRGPSRTGKALETSPFRWKMGTTPKRKRSDTPSVSPQVTPKSMRILHAGSTGTRTSNVEAAGTPTLVTVDDDSDDGNTTRTDYPGGQGGLDAFFGSAGSSTRHFSAEPVTDIAEEQGNISPTSILRGRRRTNERGNWVP
ncbi:unnamed protein product [Prunus armeniaca]